VRSIISSATALAFSVGGVATGAVRAGPDGRPGVVVTGADPLAQPAASVTAIRVERRRACCEIFRCMPIGVREVPARAEVARGLRAHAR
jgi:hypothetical protein